MLKINTKYIKCNGRAKNTQSTLTVSRVCAAKIPSLCVTAFMYLFAIGVSVPVYASELDMVLKDEHKLEVRIQGDGAYTVVFESGLGHDLTVWDDVADAVSQFAKVVRYSRAGYGGSEPSDKPRTLEQVAKELDNLLTAEKIVAPYILVGHSAGGFYIRKYAELYPEKVQGFVFVDSTPERILVQLRKLDPARAAKDEVLIDSMTPNHVKPEYIYFSKITETGVYPATADLPDVPTALITAMKKEYPRFLMHSTKGKEIWRNLQAEFISQFTNNLHIVSSISGHNIHRDQPEIVVDAVKYVLRESTFVTKEKLLTSGEE